MKNLLVVLLLAGICFLGRSTVVYAQEKTSKKGSDSCATELLRAPIEDNARTQIMILGTPHLRSLKDSFRSSQLDSLVAALAKYKPDLIGVESMSGSLIGELERRGGPYQEVIEQFAKDTVENGHAAQKLQGISRDEAEKKAGLLWVEVAKANTAAGLTRARLNLVLILVAAYDTNTALLQWSYLPEEQQAKNEVIPADITKYLNQQSKLPDEVEGVSIRLAHQLGLQRIESVDDYEYVDLFAPIQDQFVKELTASPLYAEVAKATLYADSDKKYHQAADSGNLLPYYLYLNSEEYSAPDVQTQWGFFLRTQLPSGYDRTQVVLWEVRNLDIASHIRRATALHPGKRMLMTIGAAHRPFLESYLSQMMDVKIVHLRDFTAN
jgi:hypothetical protein